jgi:thiol-disulfide isomerase/thioredoxin
MVRVELYGKPDCPRCAEALATLTRLQTELPFDLVRVDVTLDPAVLARYQRRVPVVFVEGREAFQGRVPEREARRRLERAQAQTEGSEAGATGPIPLRTFRTVKIAFLLVAVAAVGGVLASKAFVLLAPRHPALPQATSEEAFLVGPEGGGRIPGELKAPELAVETLNGKPFSLADARGQVVFVNFWATWCPPCRSEMPSMLRLGAELAKAYPGQFKMVAVSVDEGWEPVRTFFGGALPPDVVLALDRNQTATRAYFCAARGQCPESYQFPESYIVDKRGRLAAYVVSSRDWSDAAAKRFLVGLIKS